jgi:hypothetical protein
MPKVKQSQKARVLNMLRAGRKLTQAQARTWNILSLSSTVTKLRHDGYDIDIEPFRNRRGRTVARYSLGP